MANIIDYAERRGGVPLSRSPLNEVDALILSVLAYMPLGVAVGGAFDGGVPLSRVARALLDCGACEGLAFGERERHRRLLRALEGSARFGAMRLAGFVDRHDERAQEQFSAVTFLSEGGAVAAFRGTDGTIVGWKEDFNMSFEREVPAQRSAALYAREAARAAKGPLTLCGHSKGGNLAAYAALFSSAGTGRAAPLAYNFDGPGFNGGEAARRALADASRIRTFVPQGAIVGMLLWHSEPFMVVQSDASGLLQHDPYSWLVMGGRFAPAPRRTLISRYADATVKEWLADLPERTRRRAIDGIYEVVSSADDRTLADLLDAQSLLSMLRAAATLDGETRAAIEELMTLLALAAAEAVPRAIGEAAEEFGRALLGLTS